MVPTSMKPTFDEKAGCERAGHPPTVGESDSCRETEQGCGCEVLGRVRGGIPGQGHLRETPQNGASPRQGKRIRPRLP